MNRNKVLASFLIALFFAGIFIALGFWQLDRAGQVRQSQQPYQELPVVSLSKVAKPNENLAGEAVNRIVKFSGSYVAQLDAPNQVDSAGQVGTWIVGIVEVDGGGEILVVRSDREVDMPRGDIQIVGRLFHRQYEDRSDSSGVIEANALRRIDPGLVVAQYGGAFYDGFVVAISEISNGRAIEVDRVELTPARPTTPGYYWQHIAYVVIWWLMALVVVFMPIYSRRREAGKWQAR
jgi:surfeit locus 1 family protein